MFMGLSQLSKRTLSSPFHGLALILACLLLLGITTRPWVYHPHGKSFLSQQLSQAESALTAPPLSPSNSTFDDDETQPQFELVVSHFNRNFLKVKRWIDFVRRTKKVQRLGFKLTIYTKNRNADLKQLKGVLQADRVEYLPNLGREGATMLHHIMTEYDRLAPLTMFMQDEPEWFNEKDDKVKSWFSNALRYDFDRSTGFLAMSSFLEKCDCGTCNDGKFPLMVPIYETAKGNDCTDDIFYASLWSQFIVSRERIRSHDIPFYRYLYEMIIAPDDHWIHQETEPKWILDQFIKNRKSTVLNPLFGHTLERSWAMIFNCGPRGTIGGWKGECNTWKCHCRDFLLEGSEEERKELEAIGEETLDEDLGLALDDEDEALEDLKPDPSEAKDS